MDANFWKIKKVLITGHTGFKGGWMASLLSALGAKIYGYSNERKQSPNAYEDWANQYKSSDYEVIDDLANLTKLKSFVHKINPDIVFHFAAQPLVMESYNNPLGTLQDNIIGTANLLESCRDVKSILAIIVATTDKVYKIGDKPKKFTEKDDLGGKDIYSASKACCEIVLSAYRDSFFKNSPVKICAVRAGNVIGGGDWSNDRIICDLVRAYQNKTHCIIRNPDHVRPWQHVLEPLSGYIDLVENVCEAKVDAGAWNFGPSSNNVYTVRDIVKHAKQHFDNLKIDISQAIKNVPTETQHLEINSYKAMQKLRWRPRLNLEDSVRMTFEWYKAALDQNKSLTKNQIEQYFKISSV